MKTGSFRTFHGPGRVSIARFAKNVKRGFRVCQELAPGSWFHSVDRAEYERRYFAQLDRLDPIRIWDTLHALAGGSEPVLMCWEVPPFDEKNWCHRRMVATWLADRMGSELEEIDPKTYRPVAPAGAPPPQAALFKVPTWIVEFRNNGKWQTLCYEGDAYEFATEKAATDALDQLKVLCREQLQRAVEIRVARKGHES